MHLLKQNFEFELEKNEKSNLIRKILNQNYLEKLCASLQLEKSTFDRNYNNIFLICKGRILGATSVTSNE